MDNILDNNVLDNNKEKEIICNGKGRKKSCKIRDCFLDKDKRMICKLENCSKSYSSGSSLTPLKSHILKHHQHHLIDENKITKMENEEQLGKQLKVTFMMRC